MTRDTYARRVKTTRRGLATIAFLKARFDEGRDQLDLFQPLVVEEIRRYRKDDIDLPGFRAAVRASTGVLIPTEYLRTLLLRAEKNKMVTRKAGRFWRKQDIGEVPGLARRMEELARIYLRLATRLREFAGVRNIEFGSDDDALSALMRFLDANHIGLVLGQRIQDGSSIESERSNHVVASFVANLLRDGGPLAEALEDIVKGLIVLNALLLRDIPITKRHLQGLTVFLDTGVLLRALGYAGPAEEQAATEGLRAIRAAGAQLCAFERTVDEVNNILRVYETKLGFTAGTKSLRGTPLTYHFLDKRATPSDIRQEIALVREKLEKLGIRTQEFPKYIHKYTEDEQALAEALKDPSRKSDIDEHRVWHDVRAISAVITLRRGARPRKIARAGFVFASGSTPTVLSGARWYGENYPRVVEPIVHIRSITNAAWVVRPVNASRAPIQDLVGVCSAILQPSPEIWSRFVAHLDELVTSGELDDDESIAVLAHEFTKTDLADVGSEEDIEASTVREIVERVRQSHEGVLRDRLDEKQRELEERNREVAAARAEVEAVRSRSKVQTEKIAKLIAGGIYGLLCLFLLVGAVRTIPLQWSDWTGSRAILRLLLASCLVAFLVVSLIDLLSRRFHMLDIFDRLQALVTKGVEKIGTQGNKD